MISMETSWYVGAKLSVRGLVGSTVWVLLGWVYGSYRTLWETLSYTPMRDKPTSYMSDSFVIGQRQCVGLHALNTLTLNCMKYTIVKYVIDWNVSQIIAIGFQTCTHVKEAFPIQQDQHCPGYIWQSLYSRLGKKSEDLRQSWHWSSRLCFSIISF